ncbi:hypothetical protein IUU84_05100 [Kocuria rhizophila]|uniref:hypothetical protein n=1 Tax=Kocuria rhizophila TaxID=72000 RepID=UPI00294993A9|nr:hypothetical protein [Kocuria rhizophila]MDV5998961.1 hypothetical protein [Kocuria rhizophila]
MLEETGSVRNLLHRAIDAIQGMRYVGNDGDSVFTLGSIGVEKAMKVILGCKAVEDNGAWPTMSELMSWGHDIEKLNARLTEAIGTGVGVTTATADPARLAKHAQRSTIIPLVLATFARYGKSGRFHHLNILATDQPGELDQPSEYWERVELHVRETAPEFQEVPFGDNAALDDYEKRLRGLIADELDAWWFCIHRLGVQGCFGDLGKKIGWEIWPPGRPVPNAVKA